MTLISLLILFCAVSAQPIAKVQPVNAVIGDLSYYEAFGSYPEARSNYQLRITTHLQYVEQHLLRNTPNGLSRTQRVNRRKVIRLLREYWQAGVFPVNKKYQHNRPCFIDADGRLCAVGYLVAKTAGLHIAEAINRDYQYAYINEMELEVLDSWMAAQGLTLRECAMIQPAYEPYRSIYNSQRQVTMTVGPTYRGAGDFGSLVDLSLDKFNRRGAFRPWAKRFFRYRGMGLRYETGGRRQAVFGVRTFASFFSYRRWSAYGAGGLQWLVRDFEKARLLQPEAGLMYRHRRWGSSGRWWFQGHLSYRHDMVLGDAVRSTAQRPGSVNLRLGLGYAIYWQSKFKLIDPHKLEPKEYR